MKYFPPVVGSDCESNCVSECEDGWEENRGKCYFFGQEKWTWVGAEEECKRDHDSHLASVTDQQTDYFIARELMTGGSSVPMWIGARQTFESNFEGRWAWADGCSPWNYTSWGDIFKPDGVLERECVFFEKLVGQNIARWNAGKCDSLNQQFRYVCSKSICSNDPIPTTTSPITIVLDPTTIAVGTTISILLILLVASVTILTFKKLKRRKTEAKPMKTEQNVLYGQYYNVDGERIDQGRVYVEDRNLNYY